MSKRPKVMVVMGTRPEIKMAPVLDALAGSTVLDHCLCVTGQHRDMLDQVLEILITPDHDLDLMGRIRPSIASASSHRTDSSTSGREARCGSGPWRHDHDPGRRAQRVPARRCDRSR